MEEMTEITICPFMPNYKHSLATCKKKYPCGIETYIGDLGCYAYESCIYYLYWKKTGKTELPALSEIEKILELKK